MKTHTTSAEAIRHTNLQRVADEQEEERERHLESRVLVEHEGGEGDE